MKKLALALILFLVPTFLSAQVLSRVRTHSQLGTCSKDGAVVMINDALTAGTCAAGGSALAACWCDLSTTSWISQPTAPANLSSYALLAGDADGQVIKGRTGANQPNLDLGQVADAGVARLNGSGATPPYVEVTDSIARLRSPNEATTISAADGVAYITSDTKVGLGGPLVYTDGVIERKVTNVTVADDAGGTKPTGAIPIITDFATCTCNDATGCTMSVAEPTVTSGYARSLTIVSIGTGNCEFATSAGVIQLSGAAVLEPLSTLSLVYAKDRKSVV